MKKIIGIAGGLCIINVFHVSGQNMGIGTTTPHPSARVDIVSNDRGLLIPRLTTAQRDAITNPAHSLLIFNKDNFCIEAYDSVAGQWLPVSCPSACSPCDTCPLPVINGIVGPTSICPGDTAIYEISGSGGGAFWNMPSDWAMVSQGYSSVFIPGSPGTLKGYLCNECGCVSDSISLSVGTAPSSTSVTALSQSICAGDTLILIASSSGATSFQWTIPSGWNVIGSSTSDTLKAVSTSPGTFDFIVRGCNGCGCASPDTISITVNLGTLNPAVSITGPTIACLPDTTVWKAPHSSGVSWTWTYPPSWTLISQGGDSIALMPDTVDGDLIVTVCDSNCNCTFDTLSVITDSCNSFCLAVGGTNSDIGYSIVEYYDGGLIIAGVTNSFGVGAADVYVIKVDILGNLLWTRTVGSGSNDIGYEIVLAQDSSLAIGGWAFLGDEYLYVVNLDGSGNLQWARYSGSGTEEVGYCVGHTTDGGFVSAGYKRLGGFGGNDIYISKFNSSGGLVWSKTLGGGAHERAYGIIGGPNNSVILVGFTQSGSLGGSDMYIVKLDGNGNLLWSKVVGGGGGDIASDVILTSDGGYAVVGYTSSFGAGSYDVYAVKLDSVGNLQWTAVIGGSNADYGYAIRETRDGGYIIAATTSSFGAGGEDMYIIKLDRQGNLQWTRTIGGGANDGAYGVVELSTGGYAIAGYTQSFGSGSNDVYIVKLNSSGQLRVCPGGCQTGSGGSFTTGGSIANGPSFMGGGHGAGSAGSVNSGGTLINLCP